MILYYGDKNITPHFTMTCHQSPSAVLLKSPHLFQSFIGSALIIFISLHFQPQYPPQNQVTQHPIATVHLGPKPTFIINDLKLAKVGQRKVIFDYRPHVTKKAKHCTEEQEI